MLYVDNTYIDSIIFSCNVCHWSNRTVDRQMEAMIVLWREPENCQRATSVLLCLSLVHVADETRDGELAALDPKSRSFADGLERPQSTVGGADQTVRVVEGFNGPSRRFE